MGNPIYDEEDDQFNDVDEEQVSGDTGTLLMIHRNCLAPKIDEAWQQTSLFSSTCTVKGKVCRFVIDSRFSANFVLEEAYENWDSNLRHISTHTGSLDANRAEVFVSQHTLISLLIG